MTRSDTNPSPKRVQFHFSGNAVQPWYKSITLKRVHVVMQRGKLQEGLKIIRTNCHKRLVLPSSLNHAENCLLNTPSPDTPHPDRKRCGHCPTVETELALCASNYSHPYRYLLQSKHSVSRKSLQTSAGCRDDKKYPTTAPIPAPSAMHKVKNT